MGKITNNGGGGDKTISSAIFAQETPVAVNGCSYYIYSVYSEKQKVFCLARTVSGYTLIQKTEQDLRTKLPFQLSTVCCFSHFFKAAIKPPLMHSFYDHVLFERGGVLFLFVFSSQQIINCATPSN